MSLSTPAQQFRRDAARITRDLRHRAFIRGSLKKYETGRDSKKARFQNWEAARQAASDVKWAAVNRLDELLVEFERNLTARGGHVHWAADAEAARRIILDIARSKNARRIIKSKVMTGEEIHLNEALEKAGLEVVESDLGEYICQLRHDAPYHFVFPAMHLTRGEISELFTEKLGTAPTDSPEELTMIARRVLREKYLAADIGISGANFAVAETGMISVTENEGNSRLTCALPKTHIALLGIEKVIPKLADLALLLPLLGTVGCGQILTGYNTMYGGPRQGADGSATKDAGGASDKPGEDNGPEEFHVVLLDNRRTALLAAREQRDALQCIRCGGCLNVCPIYKNIGGHTYGATYQGPIGSVITPRLRSVPEWKHLAFASSLCGACTATCPVKIDLHHHLLQTRRDAVEERPVWWEKLAFKAASFAMNHAGVFAMGLAAGRVGQVFHPVVKNTPLDPARAWTRARELPRIAPKSFHQWWKKNRQQAAGNRQQTTDDRR